MSLVLCDTGLHLKVPGKDKDEYKSFDYTWGVFTQSARTINWTPLTSTEATYPHIRLHQLREDDSLSYFMANMASIPAATAMILINSDNSYRLPERLLSEQQTPPVPTLLVTKETGRELLQLIRDHPRTVETKVYLMNETKGPVKKGWHCTILYCIILYFNILYCIILYCIALYCTILYYTVLYCTCICFRKTIDQNCIFPTNSVVFFFQ